MKRFKYARRDYEPAVTRCLCDKCGARLVVPWYERPRKTYNKNGYLVTVPKNAHFRLCSGCFAPADATAAAIAGEGRA